MTIKTDRMSLRLTTWDEHIVALMSVAWPDGRRGGLVSEGCTHVGMESTGIYWQPVYASLEGRNFLLLDNL